MDIQDIVAELTRKLNEKKGKLEDDVKIHPEAVIMRLREAAKRYARSVENCPFGLGELVTPVIDSWLHGSGEPHIVIDIWPDPEPDFTNGEINTVEFGNRFDMRVASILRGCVVAHWVESYQFKHWESKTK